MLLVVALIATLPGEPGCFYLAVGAAVAAAGGLRGWGPGPVYKQAQDVSTMAKDGPLKRRGTQRGRPGAHQRSVSLCAAEKAHVFDGYPWTWPRHRVGTRAEGLNGGKRKGKRRQRGEDRRRSWDTALRISASRSGVSQEFLLSGFVLALADLYLESSTQPLSFLLPCTSRQAFQVISAKCFVCNFTSTCLESAIATAGGCWGFSLPDLVV